MIGDAREGSSCIVLALRLLSEWEVLFTCRILPRLYKQLSFLPQSFVRFFHIR